MTKLQQPEHKPSRILCTIAVAVAISIILFAALWYTVFNAVTAALMATGGAGLIVVGVAVSDIFESVMEMLANALLAILGAIAAVLAAILSIFE